MCKPKSSLDGSITVLFELMKELGRDVTLQASRVEKLDSSAERARLIEVANKQTRVLGNIRQLIDANS